MKIGISSGLYINYSIDEALCHIADAGYDCVDIWGGRPHVYRHDFSPTQLRRLRQQIGDLGMTVSSFMPAFYRYPHSLTDPRETVRLDSVQYMRECIDNAAELGAPILLVVPLQVVPERDLEVGRKQLTRSIGEVCDYARQVDVRLGLEVLNPRACDFVNSLVAALRLLDELDDPALGLVLDTGHLNLMQETTEEAIRLAADRLLQVHVNDNDGLVQQNLVPGDGTFDFAGLIDVLAAAGFDGVLSAELDYRYAADPDPPARLAAQRLRVLLGAQP